MTSILKNTPDSSKIFTFTPRDFARVRALIYRQAGISLAESKQEMVYSRLARRLRAKGLDSFEVYLDGLESGRDSEEWEAFTNALTTNLTSFFREAHHFPILAEHALRSKKPLSIWCSASSTGEEPYSIAMTLCEAFNTLTPPVSIVATDIDTNVLEAGATGVYTADRLEKMSSDRVRRFFLKGKGSRAGMVRVRPELRQLITFKTLNL
ncbi:MAG: CheR family methyltransferase, partial [Thiobacillus sp.]|nr:CheR family methyltransferase [Thiobacillus sp.]